MSTCAGGKRMHLQLLLTCLRGACPGVAYALLLSVPVLLLLLPPAPMPSVSNHRPRPLRLHLAPCSKRRITALCVAHWQAVKVVVFAYGTEVEAGQGSVRDLCTDAFTSALAMMACYCPQLVDSEYQPLLNLMFDVTPLVGWVVLLPHHLLLLLAP